MAAKFHRAPAAGTGSRADFPSRRTGAGTALCAAMHINISQFGAARKGRWTDLPGWVDALPGAEDRARACVAAAATCFGMLADTATTAPAAGGVTSKVFKPIDQAQPGFYADGKWSYAYEPRQGTLKYDGRDLPAA